MKVLMLAAVLALAMAVIGPAGAEARIKNCQDFKITAGLEYVSCFAGVCAGAVHGHAYAGDFTVSISGWRLREGQVVTVTGCVSKDLSVSGVRVVSKAK